MQPNKAGLSAIVKAAIALIAVVIIAVAAFSALTYPTTVVDFPVNFTVGAATEHKTFAVSLLDSAVKVQVSISSGGALWTASILNGNGTEVWNHRAAQGGQTSYESGWITLPSGNYNFTFGTIGAGSLNAQVKVEAKGGFW